jgi:hypothetical protein
VVALGRGTTPVDAVPLAASPRAVTALPESLVALRDLPGARYVLVVDASGERVRGELGGPPDADLAVLSWARRLADVSRERGRAMEDVVLTTESAFHLVRSVPGVGEDVWVALRIDREHGNLALARRALAALVGRSRAVTTRALPSGPAAPVPGAFPAPRVVPAAPDGFRSGSGPATGSLPAAMPSAGTPMPPAPRRAPDRELPRPAARTGADVPALAFLPPSAPADRPELVAPEEVPPPPAVPVVHAPGVGEVSSTGESDDGELHASSGSSGPSSGPESAEEPAPETVPDEPGLWDPRRRPLTVRQARTWRTAPEVPPAREPAEPMESVPSAESASTAESAPSAPVIPAPRAASLFAPVVVVPPPPSPVDDDTTEVPAPVPYPIITAPPLEPAPEPVVTAPGPAPEEEPPATDAGLPRRVPGAHLRSPTPAPEPAPAAAALSTGLPGWSTEPSVLRRLLLGLRRLT